MTRMATATIIQRPWLCLITAMMMMIIPSTTMARLGGADQQRSIVEEEEDDNRRQQVGGSRKLAAMTQAAVYSWGLDRSDQRNLPLSGSNPSWRTNAAGSSSWNGAGVDIYILDGGVDYLHAEFTNRIDQEIDLTNTQPSGGKTLANSHGTNVASLAAGSSYGVAPGAHIIPICVHDPFGWGQTTKLIQGINRAIQHHNAKNPKKRSVINISLEFAIADAAIKSAIDVAIKAAVDAGIVVVVAAGDYERDACGYLPAFSTNAITVGATRNNDMRWSYRPRKDPNFWDGSNFGTCVDLFAPGVQLPCAKGTLCATTGSHFAAPQVAGAAALLLQKHPTATVANIRSMLLENASRDKVIGAEVGSPNRLLYLNYPPAGASVYASMVKSKWTQYTDNWNGWLYSDVGTTGQAICGKVKWCLMSNQQGPTGDTSARPTTTL